MLKLGWLLAAFAALGCGINEDDETLDAGVANATPNQYCDRLVARARGCEAGTIPDGAQCRTGLACRQAVYAASEVDTLYKCALTLECGSDPQLCLLRASARFDADPAVAKFKGDCTTKATECGMAMPAQACTNEFGLFSAAARASYSACLATDCGSIKACFDAVYKLSGCVP